jgi:DNA polymerase III delta prime subunit
MHPPGKSTPGVDFIKNDIRSLLDDISGSGFGFFCLAPRNVLVADECHGLTKEQAELFLKYIEDADEHNYFIFCTTEPNDVLPTLVDRCIINLKFDRVPNVEIFNLLKDGGGPRCLDSLTGGISSESVFIFKKKHQAASAKG